MDTILLNYKLTTDKISTYEDDNADGFSGCQPIVLTSVSMCSQMETCPKDRLCRNIRLFIHLVLSGWLSSAIYLIVFYLYFFKRQKIFLAIHDTCLEDFSIISWYS